MSTAIHTKFLGPTNRRGSRVKAFCKEGTGDFALTIPYPHDLPQDQKHVAAAKALAERLEWPGLWIVGHNADGSISCVNTRGAMQHTSHMHEGADYFVVEEKART